MTIPDLTFDLSMYRAAAVRLSREVATLRGEIERVTAERDAAMAGRADVPCIHDECPRGTHEPQ